MSATTFNESTVSTKTKSPNSGTANGVAPTAAAKTGRAPNYMVFCTGLGRACKAADKSGDRGRAERTRELRSQAVERYKAKDYDAAVALHNWAHQAAAGIADAAVVPLPEGAPIDAAATAPANHHEQGPAWASGNSLPIDSHSAMTRWYFSRLSAEPCSPSQ